MYEHWGGARFECTFFEGAKTLTYFRDCGGGHILSTCDFRNSTAPAVNSKNMIFQCELVWVSMYSQHTSTKCFVFTDFQKQLYFIISIHSQCNYHYSQQKTNGCPSNLWPWVARGQRWPFLNREYTTGPMHLLAIKLRPFKIECVFCIRKFWKLNARARKHNTNARNLHGPLWSKVTWFYKNRKLARWLTSLQCITSSDVHYCLGYKYIWRIKMIAFHQILKL